MAETVYINTAAKSMADSIVADRQSMRPVGIAGLMVGEQRTYNVYLVDGQGNFDSRSGDSIYAVRLGIGELDRQLIAGEWTLSWDSGTNVEEIGPLDHDATPGQLEAAIKTHSDVGPDDVRVLGTNPVFRVEWQGAYADTDVNPLTVAGNTLQPDADIKISTVQPGGGGRNERQLIRLVVKQRIIVPAADWSITGDGNGFTATADTITKDFAELLAGAATKVTSWNFEITDGSGNPEVLATRKIVVRNSF